MNTNKKDAESKSEGVPMAEASERRSEPFHSSKLAAMAEAKVGNDGLHESYKLLTSDIPLGAFRHSVGGVSYAIRGPNGIEMAEDQMKHALPIVLADVEEWFEPAAVLRSKDLSYLNHFAQQLAATYSPTKAYFLDLFKDIGITADSVNDALAARGYPKHLIAARFRIQAQQEQIRTQQGQIQTLQGQIQTLQRQNAVAEQQLEYLRGRKAVAKQQLEDARMQMERSKKSLKLEKDENVGAEENDVEAPPN
jgi:hypothetical protein